MSLPPGGPDSERAGGQGSQDSASVRLAHADTVGPGNLPPDLLTYKADLFFGTRTPCTHGSDRLCLPPLPGPSQSLGSEGKKAEEGVRGGRNLVSCRGNSHGLGV